MKWSVVRRSRKKEKKKIPLPPLAISLKAINRRCERERGGNNNNKTLFDLFSFVLFKPQSVQFFCVFIKQDKSKTNMSNPAYYDDYPLDYQDEEPEDDSTTRTVWEVFSWILVVLTIVLNLIVIGILLVRRNAYTVVNKGGWGGRARPGLRPWPLLYMCYLSTYTLCKL